jgi:hypothetical protein
MFAGLRADFPQALQKSDKTNTGRTADRRLAGVADALIEEEKAGPQELRSREKALRGDLEAGLLKMIAMDIDKHARPLDFVRCRLEARTREAQL